MAFYVFLTCSGTIFGWLVQPDNNKGFLDIKLGSSKQGNLLIVRMSNPITDSKESPQHDRKDRQKMAKKQHNALAKNNCSSLLVVHGMGQWVWFLN